MVSRFDSDYKTIAFICSLPSALLTLLGPFVYSLMKIVHPRLVIISGSFMCAVPLMCVPLVRSLPLLGFLFALTGFGLSIGFLAITITLNEYFTKSFIFFNTLSTLGVTIGAFCLPVIVEWSLTAYGYNGAFLILGGMCLHTVPCALTIRPPRDGPFAYSLMKVVQPRFVVISGSFMCAVPLMCVPLVRTLPLLGFLFGLTGHIYDVTRSYRAVFNSIGLALLSVIVILVAVFIILRRRTKRNPAISDSSQS
ncbi:monocarboxylate transporter 3-like [Diadema setosum]|uniref:monocarboxylate transporter 3-like n=1 Tax=Diadema setosum TaxID=31175 RepID=UPI003B3A86F7